MEGDKAQPFEDFIQWAPRLIGDFDEADRNLADARQLFSALNDSRAISLWNPDNRPLTDFEKQYLKFYNSLYRYYSSMIGTLLECKQAYPGLICRMASIGIEKFSERLPWEKVIFTGFNAVTAAEEKIMDFLYSVGKAQFLWDADAYYLNDKDQEAGDFLRKSLKKWGGKEFNWVATDLTRQPRHIYITGVPNNISQASLAGEIVKKLDAFDERSAIVLQDENLLIPLLYSLPENAGELNITMGLPLTQTPFADMLALVFRMHLNKEKFTQNRRNGGRLFYFRDVLSVLHHPYVASMAEGLMKGDGFVFERIVQSIAGGNKVFLSADEILDPGTGLFSAHAGFLRPFFHGWSDPLKTLGAMKEITGILRDYLISEQRTIELEYIYSFSSLVYRLDDLLRTYPGTVKSLSTLFSLYNQMVRSVTLPFSGEPVRGLQIMGMLETRGLDFENLIMLSCNENLLPKGGKVNSFIPADLRLEFGLPTHRHKDAVYAYHFYRLLQRAKNIHLVYNSETGEFGEGEISRFLQQVSGELKRSNPLAEISEEILVLAPSPDNTYRGISIPKDDSILSSIRKKAEKGFSPTSLNNYRACTLKFYFSDLAEIKEPEEMEEEIDNRILGNIVHAALKKSFEGFIGKELDAGMIAALKPGLDSIIEEACKKEFAGRDVRFGRNLLLLKVARIMLRRFVESESRNVNHLRQSGKSLQIIGLEQHLERRLTINTGSEVQDIRIRGFADRIDSIGGQLRIIDYKTGSTDKKRTSLKDWGQLVADPSTDHAFQLLMYIWLYFPRVKNALPLQAGILSLRKISEGLTAVSVPGNNENEAQMNIASAEILKFETKLKEILSAIFDASLKFTQTSDLKTCANCPYLNLCGR
jgi:RecB family exonuclease